MPEAQADGSNTTHDGAQPARTLWGVLQWWPTLLGIGLAAFVALDMSSSSGTLAPGRVFAERVLTACGL